VAARPAGQGTQGALSALDHPRPPRIKDDGAEGAVEVGHDEQRPQLQEGFGPAQGDWRRDGSPIAGDWMSDLVGAHA
jgi:hypothetical protein